jgi:hypothetical protein
LTENSQIQSGLPGGCSTFRAPPAALFNRRLQNNPPKPWAGHISSELTGWHYRRVAPFARLAIPPTITLIFEVKLFGIE